MTNLVLVPNGAPPAVKAAPKPETLRPLGNYVLVKRAKPDSKSKGGVLVPESVQREQKKTNPIAIVLAVGPGLPMDGGARYPMDVKVGDTVQLLRTLAEAVLVGVPEESLWLVDVGQILGVVESEMPDFQRAILEADPSIQKCGYCGALGITPECTNCGAARGA